MKAGLKKQLVKSRRQITLIEVLIGLLLLAVSAVFTSALQQTGGITRQPAF